MSVSMRPNRARPSEIARSAVFRSVMSPGTTRIWSSLVGLIDRALVEAYRDRDYGSVETARSIRPTNDEQIQVVPRDHTDRNTAEPPIYARLPRLRTTD